MELTTHKLRISQSTVNTILSRAQGHYKSILLSAGADETIFKTKNLECPWCAGVDRFSYTDKFGKGDCCWSALFYYFYILENTDVN